MNAAKAKGTRGEVDVVAYLMVNGFPTAERRALRGVNDAGDVAGIAVTVIEVKNCDRVRLAEWMDELTAETRNAGAEFGAVWHKRRGKSSPGFWYVTMPGWVFVRLLLRAHRLRDLELNGRA